MSGGREASGFMGGQVVVVNVRLGIGGDMDSSLVGKTGVGVGGYGRYDDKYG